jgi:hypothetical protein
LSTPRPHFSLIVVFLPHWWNLPSAPRCRKSVERPADTQRAEDLTPRNREKITVRGAGAGV